MGIKNFLALDTSMDTAIILLVARHKSFSRLQEKPREHNQFLLVLLQELLDEAGMALSDVHAYMCGVGPGSFVGVRLGVAVVQGLAYANQKPVYALNSLALQAQAFFRSAPQATEVIIAHNAHMQGFYLGHYQNIEGIAQSLSIERLVHFKVPIHLKIKRGVMIVGNARIMLIHMLNTQEVSLQGGIVNVEEQDLETQARHIVKIKPALTAQELQPIYCNDKSHWQKLKKY